MTKLEMIEKIMSERDEDGCWNVEHSDNYGPDLTYYVPNYNSTLWTLILLADIELDKDDERVIKPLKTIMEHFWDEENGIFTIGKSHFTIPCLNGNMIYLMSYFKVDHDNKLNRVINFFNKYQRFDDGDFKTPSEYPYYRNKSCYSKHTCYWGVVKLFKGLVFISENERSPEANKLLEGCTEFILLHQVCFSSTNPDELLHKMIGKLTIPNMYKADFLEILWLLNIEGIKSVEMIKALELLESKRQEDGTWVLERQVKNLTVSLTKKKLGNELITKRANEVINYQL